MVTGNMTVQNGYWEVAERLISSGANITLGDLQPLVTASKHLEYEMVKLLLEVRMVAW